MKRQITAVVLAAATGVVGFGPAAAYADPATALTAADMVAAVAAISTATKAASTAGWAADGQFPGASWAKIVVDTPHGLGSERYNNGARINEKILVDHQGLYDSVGPASQRAALKMIGRPDVRYVYAADTSIDLSGGPLGPETKNELGDASGVKVSHDDGTIDYVCEMKAAGLTETWRVDAAGVLISDGQAGATGETPETYVTYVTYTYSYGAQTVTRPTAAQTITANGLRRATAAYQMPSEIKKVAALAASAGRAKAGSRTAKVTTVRSQARKHAESLGREDGGTNIIKVTNVSNGVRVYGTNPYTHHKVSYQVTVSRSKKISVTRG